MELENQGGYGTEFTHLEKRIFGNEAMTGTYTHNPVFSRVTLALMEDTGWYVANYSNAENLTWGRDMGCDFVHQSCYQFGLQKVPFCEGNGDGKSSMKPNNVPFERTGSHSPHDVPVQISIFSVPLSLYMPHRGHPS